VLKGVVRVEALATPSEHIPALLERVKPVYLSRTYGVSLPSDDDASKAWDADVFLDRLARMKGRLLKGGEPDVDGVAKIVLTDWVRGRIPFFVPPPERSEELNMKEAKERAKAARSATHKGKPGEDAEAGNGVVGPKQNLGSIMQKNTFLAEDIRPIEQDAEGTEELEDVDDESEEDGEDSDEAEDEEDEFTGLSWGDVFPEGVDETKDQPSGQPSSTEG
jgi:nuclear GTP-binding protein